MKKKQHSLARFARRFSKFSVVGLINAVVDLAVLNLLLWAYPTEEPWQFVLYNFVALVLANVNSYVLNSLWTFRGQARPGLKQGGLFALQALVGVVVSSALFWLLVHYTLNSTALSPVVAGNVAKVISTVIASTLSYFVQRHVVFPRER
ncbi:MAG: GtrA family protein [Actinomycetota bacterium]|nr:GtrA family protein [Actinomycetota bacterium]